MKHKLWYDEENEILKLQVIGKYSSQEAREVSASLGELLKGRPHRQFIVDLSQAGKMESRETRKIQNDGLKQAQLTHVAFVGASAGPRMIARILIKLGSLNVSNTFCETIDEAVRWLKAQRRS